MTHGTEIFCCSVKKSVAFKGDYLAGPDPVGIVKYLKFFPRKKKGVREDQYVYGKKRIIHIGDDFGFYCCSNRYHYRNNYTQESWDRLQKHSTDVLTRIRTDVEEKLRRATCLLVNVAVFNSVSSGNLGIAENFFASELLEELCSLEVEIVFYRSAARDFVSTNKLDNLIERNGHCIIDDRACVMDRLEKDDCVLLSPEPSDIDLFLPGNFSVVPSSAPLDLKTVSSYVSNFEGEVVFTELGNLIVSSKRGG